MNELPDIEGEWAYTGHEIRVVGGPSESCEIRGVTLFLGRWRSEGLFGRSEGGTLTCTGELAFLNAEFPAYPVRRGGAVLDFIAFDIGSTEWRHDGRIAGDTMSGIFWLQHPGMRLEGRFRAVLRRAGPPGAAPDRRLGSSGL